MGIFLIQIIADCKSSFHILVIQDLPIANSPKPCAILPIFLGYSWAIFTNVDI